MWPREQVQLEDNIDRIMCDVHHLWIQPSTSDAICAFLCWMWRKQKSWMLILKNSRAGRGKRPHAMMCWLRWKATLSFQCAKPLRSGSSSLIAASTIAAFQNRVPQFSDISSRKRGGFSMLSFLIWRQSEAREHKKRDFVIFLWRLSMPGWDVPALFSRVTLSEEVALPVRSLRTQKLPCQKGLCRWSGHQFQEQVATRTSYRHDLPSPEPTTWVLR